MARRPVPCILAALATLAMLAGCVTDEPGARTYRTRPQGRVGFYGAIGQYSHKTEGEPARSDREAAVRGGVEIEGTGRRGLGGGLRLEGLSVDNDLFRATGGEPTDVTDGELYLYLAHLAEEGPVRVTTRAGWMTSDRHFDNASGRDIGYGTDGIRLEVAPDVALYSDRNMRWSLRGTAGVGYGWTDVHDSCCSSHSDMYTYRLGIGTALRTRRLEFAASWIHDWWSYDDADGLVGPDIPGFDAEFSGVHLSMAARF